MSTFLPTIGASGQYTAAEPFNTLLKEGISYTCIALRKFSELLKSGADPEERYYTPNKIDHSKYAADLANDVAVIVLQDTSGAVVEFPASYLTSYPSVGGVPYTSVAISVRLGPIPDVLDLTYIKSIIKDRCLETLGVDVKVDTLALTATSVLDEDSHRRLEAARLQKIKMNPTDRALMLAAQNDLAAAKQQIKHLEEYIAKNIPIKVVDAGQV